MTTATFTDGDIRFNRFDQPLLGAASDALHLVFFWPATEFGIIDEIDPNSIRRSESFKREMLRKQGGECTWCQKPLHYDAVEVDHVWPISRGGRNWVSNLQVLHGVKGNEDGRKCNQEKAASIDFALRNISPLLPHLVALIRWLSKRPRLAALIVGGIALVIAIAIVVKWLSEYVNGVRRYLRLLKSAQESLTRTATTVSRHLESAGAQALHVQSTACGFAVKARGIAGGVPTCAVHLAERARGLPSARATKAANHAARTVRGAAGVVRRAASGAVNSVPHTPGLAQRTAGRVSDALPRPWRKTRTALAVSTFGASSRVPVLHS